MTTLDSIARRHASQHSDPTGFRVLRGTTVLGWWSCHECASRGCDCHDRASKLLRKMGAPARLETYAGVVLAQMKGHVPVTKSVPMLSLAEHRARSRTVDEALAEDDGDELPADEPGGEDVEVEDES